MALKDLVRSGPAPKPKKQRVTIEPMHIDDVTWIYPLKKGLTVVHEIRDKEKYIRTDTITIKWVDVGIALGHRKLLKDYDDQFDDYGPRNPEHRECGGAVNPDLLTAYRRK